MLSKQNIDKLARAEFGAAGLDSTLSELEQVANMDNIWRFSVRIHGRPDPIVFDIEDDGDEQKIKTRLQGHIALIKEKMDSN
ncbi:MAG: hypothetical protein IH846_15240 [Acidobacteria bacterium]|nr:hypothetical protein [Acidobacteriota bacterium]